ncbi:MAG: hypothetical protein LBC75_08055 [Fibromonadaceae bacterium]|jgi:hypothetical protein|nr:hypothetical protein [Fibromonadaceae bacterium]
MQSISLKIFLCSILFLALVAYGQERQRVAILNTEDDGSPEIEFTNLNFLTGKLREIAVKVLPEDKYSVMSVQSIIDKLGSKENARKVCKEAQCIAEIGRKVTAAYVGQARLGRLDDYITINVELYNAGSGVLIGSFTGKAKKVSGLESVINANAPQMYGKMPDVQIKQGPAVAGGVSGVQTTGSGFVFEGGKNYLVNLNSEPTGAALSFDGVASVKCPKTPCKIVLGEGNVRIIAALEQYEISDTTVFITSNNQNIDMKLKPNFGYLEIKPALLDDVGDYEEWELNINGKGYNSFENRLSPGNYNVKLSHRCYEAISFTAGINKGKHEVFDMASHLTLKKGGLTLNSERNGEPVSEPVFVNGKQVGETPFSDAVPLCSEIEIGENRERVRVTLKYNENISYTHKGNLYEFYEPTNKKKEPSFSMPKFEMSGNTTFWVALGLDVLGAAMLYIGHQKHDEMWVEYDKYGALGPANNYGGAWENVESLRSSRNTFYILGSLILASGIGIHIWF